LCHESIVKNVRGNSAEKKGFRVMQHEDKEANLIQGDEYLAKITVHNFIAEYTSRDENCSHKCVGLRRHPMCDVVFL
jgi:hypothetical protein